MRGCHDLDGAAVQAEPAAVRGQAGQPLGLHGIPVQVQHHAPGVDCRGGQLQPVEHQVRGHAQQRRVLVGCRLTLGGVAHDDGRAA